MRPNNSLNNRSKIVEGQIVSYNQDNINDSTFLISLLVPNRSMKLLYLQLFFNDSVCNIQSEKHMSLHTVLVKSKKK